VVVDVIGDVDGDGDGDERNRWKCSADGGPRTA
jgi:hypothetical protein